MMVWLHASDDSHRLHLQQGVMNKMSKEAWETRAFDFTKEVKFAKSDGEEYRPPISSGSRLTEAAEEEAVAPKPASSSSGSLPTSCCRKQWKSTGWSLDASAGMVKQKQQWKSLD